MEEKLTGLTSSEVERRVAAGLDNREIEPPTKTVWQIFATNIFTFFNGIFALLAAGVIIAGSWKNLTFLIVVFANTAIGIVQELRSKKVLDKMALLTERKCTVVRDGERREVGVHDTVLGDTVVFSAGSQIFADAIVADGSVIVNEALITGEADEIKKPKGASLVSGSFVMSGECYARLTAVGENSFASKLTLEAKKSKRRGKSEMMRSLTRLVTVIGILIIPLGVAMLFKEISWLGYDYKTGIVHTVAALIGMIPEGLYLLTSIALVASVIRLIKRKTLVHELDCIETLARVDTLCVDKTGTITENKMTVEDVLPLRIDVTVEAIESVMTDYVNAHAADNATMIALKNRFNGEVKKKAVHTVPFTSSRKYGAASFEDGSTLVLGAPDFMLGDDYSLIADTVDKYSSKGCRVLLLAAFSGDPATGLSGGRIAPAALILLANKIRDSARATFRYFAENDVKVKVISGDNALAVSDVSRRAGIGDADKYIDARELDTDEKIEAAAEEYTVFGRVTPVQKKKLIAAMRKAGHTVAMTGDGVNDVLALKEADCSVAMASGSDVASQASHIVLLDSDFSAMPSVVAEGRRVINNIERSASLYLWKNIFSFVLAIVTLVFTLTYPLEPTQLSLISALAIGFPSFVLAMEPNESRVRGHFMKNVLFRSLPAALTNLVMTIGVMVFCTVFEIPKDQMSTVCALIVGFVGLLMLYATCIPASKIRVALCIAMTVALILGAVIGASFFSIVPLSTESALVLTTFGLLSIPTYIGISKLIVIVSKWFSSFKKRFDKKNDGGKAE
ncbi:MAG: HAD-IC family P-type ATPase [Clostridia bacterium]|nr:HAD-IC family P-type ATPase [Clostridia bacterium]